MKDWRSVVPAWAAELDNINGDDLSRWLKLYNRIIKSGVSIGEVADFVEILFPEQVLGGAGKQCGFFMQFVTLGCPSNLLICYDPERSKRERERWWFKAIPNIPIDPDSVRVGERLHTRWQQTDIPAVESAEMARPTACYLNAN